MTIELLTQTDSGQILIKYGKAVYNELNPYASLYVLSNLNELEFLADEGVSNREVMIEGFFFPLLLNTAWYKNSKIVT